MFSHTSRDHREESKRNNECLDIRAVGEELE